MASFAWINRYKQVAEMITFKTHSPINKQFEDWKLVATQVATHDGRFEGEFWLCATPISDTDNPYIKKLYMLDRNRIQNSRMVWRLLFI